MERADPMRRSPSLPHNPALDGLRAIAVAGILLFHADLSWARGGFLGVSAFFTLSGFLITRLLLAERERTNGIALRAFWGRRFRRLAPAALLGLVGVALYGAFLSRPGELPALSRDAIASLFYVANWRFVAAGYDYAAIFRAASPAQHYWSLGIEEQFYLFYPLLLIGLLRAGRGGRRWLAWALLALICASTGLMAWLQVPGEEVARVYYGTDTRAAELFVGALLAVLLPLRDPDAGDARAGFVPVLGGAALLASLFCWTFVEVAAPWLYRGGLLVHAGLMALVLAAAARPGFLRSALATPPLPAIGLVSYGLYVYHWPVYLWLSEARTGLGPVPLLGVRLLVTGAIAIASYRFIEAPVRSGVRFPGRRGVVAASAGVSIVLVALLGLGAGAGVDEIAFDETSEASEPVMSGEGPRVMVVGDSIGWSIGGGLLRWARETGRMSVWVRAKPGCAIARGGERMLRSGPRRDRADQCWKAVLDWQEDVARFEPDVVIVVSGGFDLVDRRVEGWPGFLSPGDPAFDAWLLEQYRASARVLGSGGAQLLWLSWPCPEQKEYRGAYGGGTGAFAPERVAHLNQVLLPRLAEQQGDRMTLVDLFGHVCPGGRFSNALGPFSDARADGLHFQADEAVWIAEWLDPAIRAAATKRR